MVARRTLALVVLSIVLGLRPMAFADPPDQSWLGGLWDDADYDDVIVLLTGGATTATVSPQATYQPDVGPVIGAVADSATAPVFAPVRSGTDPRAPPDA